jgi:hypothetical protein
MIEVSWEQHVTCCPGAPPALMPWHRCAARETATGHSMCVAVLLTESCYNNYKHN